MVMEIVMVMLTHLTLRSCDSWMSTWLLVYGFFYLFLFLFIIFLLLFFVPFVSASESTGDEGYTRLAVTN